MLIRFFGPFEKLVGKEVHINLTRKSSLSSVISLLRDQYAGLTPYLEYRGDADLSYHIMFVKDGRPLKLDDRLCDHDTLQVLLPVTGG